jgi:low affinity Fe/Cu permease
LSNPSAREQVDLTDELLARPREAQPACHVALREARRQRIRDVLDPVELAQQHRTGMTIKQLAAAHTISESSVKRMLRAGRAKRRHQA